MSARDGSAPDVSLAEKVAYLRRPETYGGAVSSVDVRETHYSWVFLTDGLAFKMKKPVLHDIIDFRTLESREANCAAEVRLNRRLAPSVYLGMVPLTLGESGLRIEGDGAVVDWLVKMRRLPEDRMLDAALRAGTATEPQVRLAARLLVDFYRRAEPVDTAPAEYAEYVRNRIRGNRAELEAPEHGLPVALVNQITATLLTYTTTPALARRASDGHIVEAHGDLRPEHVALVDPPVVIDCLEFDRTLRTMDPVDELAFLGVECERLDAPWVGPAVLDEYVRGTGDAPPPGLVDFYAAFRATLRAKLAVWHLRDPAADAGKWRRVAAEYLELARRHAAALDASGVAPTRRSGR